jgi:sulfur-oxidizing protein SoxX
VISATALALTALAVVGDGIPAPLIAQPGDAARGRAIVVQRQTGLCLLCHSGPFAEERTPGTVAGSLAGAGSRWTAAQLRLRVADARRLDPDTPMPSFHRPDAAGERVGAAWRGRPILDAQQVEDVVAFLLTLKD